MTTAVAVHRFGHSLADSAPVGVVPPQRVAAPRATPVTMTTTDPLIGAWAARMRAEGLSDRTVREWPRIVTRVARLYDVSPDRLDQDAIVDYLGDLPTAATRQAYYSALKAWHSWLVATRRRADDPMAGLRRPRAPRGEPHPVATGHIELLLSSGVRRRTVTAMLLGAYQGLRVSEIARVRGEDFDLVGQRMRVYGKGGVTRWAPLHPVIAAEAEVYPRHGWWFPSHTRPGRPILRTSLSASISRAMKRAGVPGTAHSLRHWTGTELTRGGIPTRVVQRALRHQSIQSTQIYTAVADEQVRAALMTLPMVRHPIPNQRTRRNR